MHSDSADEKAGAVHGEHTGGLVQPHAAGGYKSEVERIDAMATAEGTTLASFAHLDEKKIMRKVWRPSFTSQSR